VRPRPPNATSIPTLLKSFQDEWDATMLEAFELKKANHELRQELTHALYQHDAACRVIARLTKERDQARQALATLSAAVPSTVPTSNTPSAAAALVAAEGKGPTAMQGVEASGIPADVLEAIDLTGQSLSAERKKRTKPENLATPDVIKGFGEKSSHKGMHTASNKSITSMSVRDDIVLTGGADKHAVLFDLSKGEVVATLKGHTKKVLDVQLHPRQDIAVTGSADSSIRIWAASRGECVHEIQAHNGGVSGISIHPTYSHLLSSGGDNQWTVVDLAQGKVVATLTDVAVTSGFTGIRTHPDGFLCGIGTAQGVIRIWSVKEQAGVATFESHTGAIKALAFSESGYHLASTAEDGSMKLWDLRKQRVLQSVDFDAGHSVNAVAFDHSGSYLAVAGTDVRTYAIKPWELMSTINEHKKDATGVHWLGTDARSLITCGNDNTLRVFG